MRIATVLASVLAVLAVAAPVASADPAEVTMHCISFDAHVPGTPQERQGEMTVTLGDGTVVVHQFVVGPCSTNS